MPGNVAGAAKPSMKDQPRSQLLSHIVSRWSNRTEDIAVDALGFILSRSRRARAALQSVVETAVQDIGELTGARTQVTGDDGARPDLVVFGRGAKERVIVEAKFWAELTENQPGAYLARLPDDGIASALLFVAPEKRLESLWIELRRRMQNDAVTSTSTEHDGLKCLPVGNGQRVLVLTSWRLMLGRMLTSAIAADDPIASDIHQLQALCEQQDATAFLPIKAEEFAPAIPRRILQVNQLVDDAVSIARAQRFVNTDGLIATPQRYGYGRYLRLGSQDADRWGGAWFGVNLELWAKFADTPLGLTFSDNKGWNPAVVPVPELRQVLGEKRWAGTRYTVPVYLPTGMERNAVLEDVVGQLSELAGLIGA